MLDSIAEAGIEKGKKVGSEAKKGQSVGFFFDNLGNYDLKLIIPKMVAYFALISIIIITFLTKIYVTENVEQQIFENVANWLLYNIQYLINIKINLINEAGNYVIAFFKNATDINIPFNFNISKFEIENKTPETVTMTIYVIYSIFISIYLYFSLLQFKIQQDFASLGITFLYVPIWAIPAYQKRKKRGYYYAKNLKGNKYRVIANNNLLNYLSSIFDLQFTKQEQAESHEVVKSFLFFYKYKKMSYLTKEIIQKNKEEKQKKEEEKQEKLEKTQEKLEKFEEIEEKEHAVNPLL